MYILHVCTVFRDVRTVLSNYVRVVRIPDVLARICPSSESRSFSDGSPGPTLAGPQ